jgi:hypothetical protein
VLINLREINVVDSLRVVLRSDLLLYAIMQKVLAGQAKLASKGARTSLSIILIICFCER